MFLYQLPFKLINNFIYPSVWINEKLTSTCQNHEIGIGIAYFNCSADLVSCSLNKFVWYFELEWNLGGSVSHHTV